MTQPFSLGDRHKERVSIFIAPSIVIRHLHKNSVQMVCVHHCYSDGSETEPVCLGDCEYFKETVLFNKLFSVWPKFGLSNVSVTENPANQVAER